MISVISEIRTTAMDDLIQKITAEYSDYVTIEKTVLTSFSIRPINKTRQATIQFDQVADNIMSLAKSYKLQVLSHPKEPSRRPYDCIVIYKE
jgi:hypothetical protein